MCTEKRSGEHTHLKLSKDRREFLEKTIATTGLLLIPSGSNSFAQTKTGDGKTVAQSNKNLASAPIMAVAAETFLNSLTSEQRAKAAFAFRDEQRLDWHFVPRERKGVPFKELDLAQQHLANALLSAGLGQRGLIKAATIMSLETILREIEQGRGPVRDPALYYLSIFGDPKSQRPWAWRIEGHHISVNFTIINDSHIATTPFFFGANPAEVQHGSRKGLRTLSGEEDLARALLKSLNDDQRKSAVVSNEAPRDILSGNSRKASPVAPAGIQASKLSQKQQDILMNLLKEYAANMPPDIAAARMEKIRAAGFGNISFAWAGGAERGQAHYYRVQGPSFLIEYDNIQNNANHIHSVWRDFNGDFGLDLLAMHYKDAHHQEI